MQTAYPILFPGGTKFGMHTTTQDKEKNSLFLSLSWDQLALHNLEGSKPVRPPSWKHSTTDKRSHYRSLWQNQHWAADLLASSLPSAASYEGKSL